MAWLLHPCHSLSPSALPMSPSLRASLSSTQLMKPVIFFAHTQYQTTCCMFLVLFNFHFLSLLKSKHANITLFWPIAVIHVLPFFLMWLLWISFSHLWPLSCHLPCPSTLRLPSEGLWHLCHSHSLLWWEVNMLKRSEVSLQPEGFH